MENTEVLETEKDLENVDDAAKDPDYVEGYKFVSNLLEKCGVQRLLSKFIEEEIDDDFSLNLNLDSELEWSPVSALLPTIGSRGKFRLALKELQVR